MDVATLGGFVEANGHRTFALEGVVSVLPTPFFDDGRLDPDGLRALVEVHAAARVAGLTALGAMGESAELSEDEREHVLAVVRATAPDLPLVVGVTAGSVSLVRERALGAVAAGASAVMVSPTTDVPAADAVRAAAAAGLPIVLQDYPSGYGVGISATEMVDLAARERLVVGAKIEAPPTPGKIAAVRRRAPRLGATGGLGGLYLIDELRAGATGVMTGFALPERLVDIVRTFAVAPDAAERTWTSLLPLMRLEAFPPFSLAARKEVWRLRGVIDSSHCRRAGAVLDARARADIRRSWEAVTEATEVAVAS